MTTITKIITSIQGIINLLVPLVFAVAFIVFIFGIFQYFILGGANEEKRAQGKQLAVWGIIAFAIMLSVWGIVNVITGTLNFGSNTKPCLPTFTGPCASGSSNTNSNIQTPTGTSENIVPPNAGFSTPPPADPAAAERGVPQIY